MRVAILGFVVLALVGLGTCPVQAQGNRTMAYNPQTEVTINGTVEKVEHMHYGNMPRMGLHLIVKAGNETNDVRLGPADFVEKSMTFKEGDTVQVVASKATVNGKTVFIAREVTKGEKVLKLRDEHGVPLWSRGRRGVGRVS